MKNFAYIKDCKIVGKIIWKKNDFYKIKYKKDGVFYNEIFIDMEIELRDTDGYREMSASEIKKYIKDGRLKESELDDFISYIKDFTTVDVFGILYTIKDSSIYNKSVELLKKYNINI